MLTWNLYEFYGAVPRLRGKQQQHGYATVAHDLDLTHGTLKPWLEPKPITEVSDNSIRFFSWDCNIIPFSKCVDVATYLPDCPRLFVNGRMPYPEVATYEDGELIYRRLGVLRPPEPPKVMATNVTTDLSRSVAYVTTFVNALGDESAPSLPSRDVVIENTQPVEIEFDYSPPLEYDIKKVRIYRRETGFRTGEENEQEPATNWFLVAEKDISDSTHTDRVAIDSIGRGLTTKEVREPPKNIRNLTAIDDMAMLAGSVGNKLLFSENMKPHSFPVSQEMTLDDNINALASQGADLFVVTDGYPYRVEATAGCDDRKCRQVFKYDMPHPLVACHTGSGYTLTPMGLVYASTTGLVLLTNSTDPVVISSSIFSEDDWRKLEPHTMRMTYYRGALFVVSDAISFILWIDESSYADTKHKRMKMSTFSDAPVDMTMTRQGELLFLYDDGKVSQWNAGNKWRPYEWVSEPVDTGYLFTITRMRAFVRDYKVKATIESDYGEVSRVFPKGEKMIPYSRLGRHKTYHLRLEGIGEVTEISLGVSEKDISSRSR